MKGKQPCTATCSYFRCGQRALFLRATNPQKQPQQQFQRGPPGGYEQRTFRDGTPFCNWVGDVCVVHKCNYAFCERRALLPDGSCALEERDGIRQSRSIEEEAQKEEPLVTSAKGKLLKKRGIEFIE